MNYWPGTSIPISRHNGFDISEYSPWTEQFCASLRKSTASSKASSEMVNRKHLSFDSNTQATTDHRAAIKKASI